jgi:hypothetical protein
VHGEREELLEMTALLKMQDIARQYFASMLWSSSIFVCIAPAFIDFMFTLRRCHIASNDDDATRESGVWSRTDSIRVDSTRVMVDGTEGPDVRVTDLGHVERRKYNV